MSDSDFHPIHYYIQSNLIAGRPPVHRLMIAHRDGRGLISTPEIRKVLNVHGQCVGYFLNLIAADGRQERIGSHTSPLPADLIGAAQSQHGLTIVFIDLDAQQVAGGQILYLDDCSCDQASEEAVSKAPSRDRLRA